MSIENYLLKNIDIGSPYWLQETAGNLYLSYKNMCELLHPARFKFRNFLNSSQWLPARDIERHQLHKLRQLLRYAYNNIPYYRRLFQKHAVKYNDVRSLKELQNIPILTKDDFIADFDTLISPKADKKYLKSVFTSGTTGVATQLYRDSRDEYIDQAFARRALSAIGIKGYQRHAFIWLTPFVLEDVGERYIYQPHLKRLLIAPRPHEDDFWADKLQLIRRYKPFNLRTSPSLLYDLACYTQEHNITDITFQCIVTHFENLFAYQRELAQRQFGCAVYSLYTTREGIISAFECPQQNGWHIDAERGIVEIIDEKGKVLPAGERGRIIATGFFHRVMPLIRFEIGDIGSFAKEPCPCGRGLPLLASLDGRTSEAIKIRNKIITPGPLGFLLKEFKDTIKECQFIQEDESGFTVNVVPRAEFGGDDTARLVSRLRELTDEAALIKINLVASIPRTAMGKFSLVISRVKT